jgi:hypothetical protein
VFDFVPRLPGGRWLTVMSRPSSLASLEFAFPQPHPRAVAAPPSAVISNRPRDSARPTVRHHWRMLLTANAPCRGQRRHSPNRNWREA